MICGGSPNIKHTHLLLSDLPGDVENMGGARLCLPTVRGTVLSSVVSSTFIFIGLLALSAAENGLYGFPRTAWLTLALRYLGWAFLFYIPIHFMSVPLLAR